jgi:c-di-GMP-binding flagellar brake protein YcgR
MDEKYSGQERRRFKRAEVNFIVFYKVKSPLTIHMRFGDTEINALALDVSEGGMAVLTDYDLPALSIVTVRFIMLDDNAPNVESRTRSIEVKGEVRYNFFIEEEREYRLGIQFIGLSDEDRNFIANFVKAQG